MKTSNQLQEPLNKRIDLIIAFLISILMVIIELFEFSAIFSNLFFCIINNINYVLTTDILLLFFGIFNIPVNSISNSIVTIVLKVIILNGYYWVGKWIYNKISKIKALKIGFFSVLFILIVLILVWSFLECSIQIF